MNSIRYVKGCAIEHACSLAAPVIVPHIVNNAGVWRSGFVAAVSRYTPIPEQRYKQALPALGEVQMCRDGNLLFANMCAQTFGDSKPIKYASLIYCMEHIAHKCQANYIVAPKFGSLRAGGNWEFIVELIEELWCPGFDVTICEYDETGPTS